MKKVFTLLIGLFMLFNMIGFQGVEAKETDNKQIKPIVWSEVSSEAAAAKNGTLSIDGKKVSDKDGALFTKRSYLISLRTVLENIGATVTWNETDQTISIQYQKESYVLQFNNTLFDSSVAPVKELCVVHTSRAASENAR